MPPLLPQLTFQMQRALSNMSTTVYALYFSKCVWHLWLWPVELFLPLYMSCILDTEDFCTHSYISKTCKLVSLNIAALNIELVIFALKIPLIQMFVCKYYKLLKHNLNIMLRVSVGRCRSISQAASVFRVWCEVVLKQYWLSKQGLFMHVLCSGAGNKKMLSFCCTPLKATLHTIAAKSLPNWIIQSSPIAAVV